MWLIYCLSTASVLFFKHNKIKARKRNKRFGTKNLCVFQFSIFIKKIKICFVIFFFLNSALTYLQEKCCLVSSNELPFTRFIFLTSSPHRVRISSGVKKDQKQTENPREDQEKFTGGDVVMLRTVWWSSDALLEVQILI